MRYGYVMYAVGVWGEGMWASEGADDRAGMWGRAVGICGCCSVGMWECGDICMWECGCVGILGFGRFGKDIWDHGGIRMHAVVLWECGRWRIMGLWVCGQMGVLQLVFV